MKTAGHLLQVKGHAVWSVAPEDTVLTAIRRMAEKNVGALLVLDGERLVGVVSERDYARKVILQGRAAETAPVREIMSSPVVFVRPETTIPECMALMTARHIRHLPVMQDERVVGVISIGDAVKEIISDQQDLIQHLENYITGGQ